MKLLFDHNLSPRLVNLLADLHPNSQHVFLLGMDQANDQQIWDYASQHDFTIVTRDSDYNDLSLMRGFPPKVIWIRRGNCSTQTIAQIVRSATDMIQRLAQDSSISVLTLY
jgi:predicted nuclease of predicted toxin-antitoxin system